MSRAEPVERPAHRARRDPSPEDERLAAEILDRLSQTVFACGLGGRIVEAKWPGIRAGFREFRLARVAEMTGEDVEALAGDPRVIRNPAKLGAVVENARRLEREIELHGSVAAWLGSLSGDDEAAVGRLAGTFRYVGAGGAGRLLGRLRELREGPPPSG